MREKAREIPAHRRPLCTSMPCQHLLYKFEGFCFPRKSWRRRKKEINELAERQAVIAGNEAKKGNFFYIQINGANILGDEDHKQPPERNILESLASGASRSQSTPPATDDDAMEVDETGSGSADTIGTLEDHDQDHRYGYDQYQTRRLEMCTESLGFESTSERAHGGGGDLTVESLATIRSRSLKRKREGDGEVMRRDSRSLEDFPPLLSTLDRYGRPRFVLESVRRDERLELIVRRNERRSVVRSQNADLESTTRLLIDDDDDAIED